MILHTVERALLYASIVKKFASKNPGNLQQNKLQAKQQQMNLQTYLETILGNIDL